MGVVLTRGWGRGEGRELTKQLSDGHPWSLIEQVLFCSTATIARWRDRFDSGGAEALLEERRGRAATLLVGWALVLVGWVKQLTPRDVGCCRGSTEFAARASRNW